MSGKVKKPCRVCGKLFTPCAYCENDRTAFHWRTIACSEECAREYFRRVMEARENKKNAQNSVKSESIATPVIKMEPVHRIQEENSVQDDQENKEVSFADDTTESESISSEEPKKKSRKRKVKESENIEQID